MSRNEILSQIKEAGAVAIVRMNDPSKFMLVAEALHKGGVSVLEITLTVPDAINLIKEAVKELPKNMLLGVGSVLEEKQVISAIEAGARFVVSPIFKPEILTASHRYDIPVMPGAFTPTEIQLAYEAGADIVKVFPAGILGMEFFNAVKAPMPHLQMMPTGGVTLANAGHWLQSGACAVGIGSDLIDKKAIANGDFQQLTINAKILMDNIRKVQLTIS